MAIMAYSMQMQLNSKISKSKKTEKSSVNAVSAFTQSVTKTE